MLRPPWAALMFLCCATGLVACSSTVRFQGKTSAAGPLRVLSSNPRYFTDGSGRAVYLTGSHHWWNLVNGGAQDPPPAFDFAAYLDFLNGYNHNFIRLWAHEQAKWDPSTTKDSFIEMSAFSRPGPALALDGKPKFDVEHFNQAYFDRLRARAVAAGARGMYVSIMLFNGWSVEPFEDVNLLGNPWSGHPFHGMNNINGIDGDINDDNQGPELHTMDTDHRLLTVRARQEAYVRKVIDTVNDLSNVLYEIGNEIVEGSTEWQYHMIRYIKDYEAGKPKQHPVGMTYQGVHGEILPHNGTLYNSPADWISPGEIELSGGSPGDTYRQDPPASDGKKVILSDTDHLWGIGGDKTWVWKSFTRGLNPIYMDPYGDSRNPPAEESARSAMGHTLMYANKMNLAAMVPKPELSSTGYCLAQPGREYLIYVLPKEQDAGPFSTRVNENVTVDLSASSESFRVEWFDPTNGQAIPGGIVRGGGQRAFTVPFEGDAVLYLIVAASNDRTDGESQYDGSVRHLIN